MNEERHIPEVFDIARTLATAIYRRETWCQPAEIMFMHHYVRRLAMTTNSSSDTTCRYYTDGVSWRVDYMDGGRTPPLRGSPGDEPEWLRHILDVARVGGYVGVWQDNNKRPAQAVWFRINQDNQLTEVIQWT